MPVGVVENLLGVGVVRCAEGVGAQPLHEHKVVDHVGVVVALAAHHAVLVLAEAAKVEGLTVDEEAGAVHLHGADANGQRVDVDRRLAGAPELDGEVVEVALTWPPGVYVLDAELARATGRPGNLCPLGVP